MTILDRFRPRSDARFLRRVVTETLAFAGRGDLEVALLLTDDATIAEYHGQFLGDPTPTDVITFPRASERGPSANDDDDDGGVDLVVNVERARRVARRTGHPIRHELALYVIHGLLHVCGHDDLKPAPRRRMRAAERAVLDRLGLSVDPVDG